ncbi:MAG: hypothetical protein KGV48_002465, partial [Alcaligenaceae bacterium]|nr:hypothetical protein [Alcaligenaceae bacterium]
MSFTSEEVKAIQLTEEQREGFRLQSMRLIKNLLIFQTLFVVVFFLMCVLLTSMLRTVSGLVGAGVYLIPSLFANGYMLYLIQNKRIKDNSFILVEIAKVFGALVLVGFVILFGRYRIDW